MTEWTIICNPKYYDIFGAFDKLKKINWKQKASIKPGDIVYIYIGKPVQEIRFKCKVNKIDIPYSDVVDDDDSEFDFDESDYVDDDIYMEIELIKKFEEGVFPYNKLKEKGLKNIQSTSRVSYELQQYLDEKSRMLNIKFWQEYNKKSAKLRDAYRNMMKENEAKSTIYGQNIILYGPPGTGKTYYTAVYAVAICDGKSIDELSDYSAVMERYNELKSENRIAFTTFHQSYGYEEFIEGLKPFIVPSGVEKDSGNVSYRVESGIFKKFCDIAEENKIKDESEIFIKADPVVWKVSLEGAGENKTKADCFANNRIRIGWSKRDKNITDKSETKSAKEKTILNDFENVMEVGDIVCVLHDQFSIDGIGIVDGEYEWLEDGKDYPRSRKIKWLAKDFVEDICDINGGKVLTSSTVYRLNIDPDVILGIAQKHSLNQMADVNEDEDTKNYVFIIDEINRGNISKIFGELITLIEPAKRKGTLEGLETVLPYSGKLFGVPSNVYILGTMNTADRSIAIMDTALRRRFQFIEMMPDISVLNKIEVAAEGTTLNVSKMLDIINERITFLYDREHTIGHAFFMGLIKDPSIERLASIFKKSVIPLLQEYFYEDYYKIQLILGDNGKTELEEDLKFIKDITVAPENIFTGNIDDIDLPNKKYEVNPKALYNIQSYKKIAPELL